MTFRTAARPTTPEADIRAWTDQSALRSGRVMLTPDLIALAQCGATILLAARPAEGRPISAAAAACRALSPTRLRIIMSRGAGKPVIDALQAGSRVAVTFTGSNQHHRAFQVKAERAVITPARPEDMPEIERQGLLFCEGLAEIGFTKELAAGWLFADTEDMIAVEVEPERIFTQTPGPGAGAELRP